MKKKFFFLTITHLFDGFPQLVIKSGNKETDI